MFMVEDHDTFIVISPVRTLMDSASLSELQLRTLLVWYRDNRKEMVRDILCDGCPEVC